MRLRKCLLVFALVLAMPAFAEDHAVAQEGNPLLIARRDERSAPPAKDAEPSAVEADLVLREEAPPLPMSMPLPQPLQFVRKDKAYTTSYKDLYHILSGHNPCSSFFGGPTKAVEVLNGLFKQLETTRMSDAKVSLEMSGPTRNVRSARTGVSYRLFDRAVINTAGPFYNTETSVTSPTVPNVGSFKPNTREARATILLHEMGHLIQGMNGRWLLPNDGHDAEQSRKNTATIEVRCGEQIKELGRKVEDAPQMPARKTKDGPVGSP